MKTKTLSAYVAALLLSVCPAALAQQVVNGAIPAPLSPTGVTSGVSMTGQGGGGSLIVGVIGGPQMDIFTNNSAAGIVTNPQLRAVSTDASSQSSIVFNSSSNVFGAIGVTNPGGPFFLNINGANNGTVVNFNGSLFGTTTTVSGTGTLNFNSGSTNISATNFAGNGTIGLAPNSRLIGAMTTNTANTGTLSLAGGSALTGAVGGANGLKAINVVGGSNAAGVSAAISGAVNAYEFNLGTNTLNVGGALTIANSTASGVINTTLASPTVYGSIRPVGATNLGSTLLINVAVPQTAFIPVGTQFNIVQTQLGTVQSGTNGSIVTVVRDPTNPLYTFSAVPAAGTIAGQVSIVTTGIPLTAVIAPPPGAPPVVITPPAGPAIVVAPLPVPIVLPVTQVIAAPVVPAVLAAAGGSAPTSDLLVNVLPAINAISDINAVVNAVAQLAPANSALAVPQVTFEGRRAFQSLLYSHLNQGACGGGSQTTNRRSDDERRKLNNAGSACPNNSQYDGLWLKGFGYFGDQSSQGAFAGYTSSVLGAMAGYDVPVTENIRAGAGVGYASSKVNGKAFTNSTSFNTYQVTAYIAHDDGRWFANGAVSYAWNGYSGSRQIVFTGINRTASAQYSGDDLTIFAATGYHFFVDELMITPQVSIQATGVNVGGYTETGAGDINLQVAKRSGTFFESGLGVSVARSFDLEGGEQLLPQLHIKWLRELSDIKMQSSAMFTALGSTPFVTSGINPSRDTLNVGAGLALLSCNCDTRTWSVDAKYDYFWRDQNFSAHQVTLAASYRF